MGPVKPVITGPTFCLIITSEVVRELDGQDWTTSGLTTLSIMFSGSAGLTGQLYCKIGNTKVVYDGEAASLGIGAWQAWNIDLAAVGGNLANVKELIIGVDGGTSGVLYIDEIRLYPRAGELITPADPGSVHVVGQWKFDEGTGDTAADSSGNGYHGTLEGNSAGAWVPGREGNALTTGEYVYVSLPAETWSTIDSQFTVAFWAQDAATLANNWAFFAGNASGRLVSGHLPWNNEVIFDTTADWVDERIIQAATDDLLMGHWHHWAFIKNADTGEKQVYLDGRLFASASASATPITGVDRFNIGAGDDGVAPYDGQIDEFTLFNRALSAAEVLGLAGGTLPLHKAF